MDNKVTVQGLTNCGWLRKTSDNTFGCHRYERVVGNRQEILLYDPKEQRIVSFRYKVI